MEAPGRLDGARGRLSELNAGRNWLRSVKSCGCSIPGLRAYVATYAVSSLIGLNCNRKRRTTYTKERRESIGEWLFSTFTEKRELFPDAEAGEDPIEDIVRRRCAGDGVDRLERGIEVKQQHLMRQPVA